MNKQITIARKADITSAYTNLIKNGAVNIRYLSREIILDILFETKAPRYYISWKRCRKSVYDYIKDNILPEEEQDREMVLELTEKYKTERRRHPDKPMLVVWDDIVNSEASSFFVSKRVIQETIYNYRHD